MQYGLLNSGHTAKRKDEVAKVNVEVGIIREGKDEDKGSGASCPNWERGGR